MPKFVFCIFLRKDMHSILHCIPSFLDMQYNQQLLLASKQRIVVGCMDRQRFHWSRVLCGDICLDIRRWWLVTMVEWWHSYHVCCINIDYNFHWIPNSMANKLDIGQLHQYIEQNSYGYRREHSSHQLFHYSNCLDIWLVVVWFQ